MPTLIPGQHIHLIGIGGYGMSAIARVLLQQGFAISGSDRAPNLLTEALAADGATIYSGHHPDNVRGAELVVISSAVKTQNPEVLAALNSGIPVYKRSEVIAAIMSGQTGICVAGTHGKTTTTAMITHILLETGQHPSYIVGGVLRSSGHNAAFGSGRAFVIEADEYDNMFLGLRPHVAVITNVEYDHPDFFPTPGDVVDTFRRFCGLIAEGGVLVACADDPGAHTLVQESQPQGLITVTYGIEHPAAQWHAANIRTEDEQTVFEVLRGSDQMGTVYLSVPGRHNVLNALAALVVAETQGVPFAAAALSLSRFKGTARRFELRDDINGVAVVDDYAHHPTAIRATIRAARQRYPERALWVVWQPHTYSRTAALRLDYIAAFGGADHVLVTDIFAAREAPVPGVDSASLVAAMRHPDARHTGSLERTLETLLNEAASPAVLLVLSAGDATRLCDEFIAARRKK